MVSVQVAHPERRAGFLIIRRSWVRVPPAQPGSICIKIRYVSLARDDVSPLLPSLTSGSRRTYLSSRAVHSSSRRLSAAWSCETHKVCPAAAIRPHSDRCLRTSAFSCVASPACLLDNLKPRALKQARDTLAENNVVLRQRDASWACGHGYDYRPSATCRRPGSFSWSSVSL